MKAHENNSYVRKTILNMHGRTSQKFGFSSNKMSQFSRTSIQEQFKQETGDTYEHGS